MLVPEVLQGRENRFANSHAPLFAAYDIALNAQASEGHKAYIMRQLQIFTTGIAPFGKKYRECIQDEIIMLSGFTIKQLF